MLRLENISRPHSVRRGALEKLAELSATSSAGSGQSDLARLCQRCPKLGGGPNATGHAVVNGTAASVPMKLPELEVLLALCKAAPFVNSAPTAEKLFRQLSPYLAESYMQAISNFSSLRYIDPSPWESLTCSLVSALLSLGLNHLTLRIEVASVIHRYIDGWAQTVRIVNSDQFEGDDYADPATAATSPLSRVLTATLSILGFLDAATKHARFWSPQERVWLADTLRDALSDKFTLALEAALSIVRNARAGQRGLKSWKKCTKHYAALGRPLGAMLLHDGYTEFLVASAALLTAPSDRALEVPILDYLQQNHPGQGYTTDTPDDALANGLVAIVTDKMESLRNDLDYLQQVGSAWQQRLAARVKGHIFVTFLCCTVFSSEVADPDRLLEWLETTLADPVQIADEALAAVVLKCMPVLARVSSDIASSLSRSLPKFIVQSGLDNRTATLAANCLASILHLLPQDAVITTMYSLGNVLSGAKSGTEARGSVSGSTTLGNGSLKTQSNIAAAASNTSLSPSEAAAIEEASDTYFIVIEAVVGIAISCEDHKITALALSMLIQKLGKVSQTVDAKIITETARLGRYAEPSELRGLLKIFTKICHDALVKDSQLTLFAVMNARMCVARDIGVAFAASHSASDPSNSMSSSLTPSTELFEVLLTSFLDTIVSKGDVHDTDNKSRLGDIELAAQEIAQLLAPLSTLVSANAMTQIQKLTPEERQPYIPSDAVVALQRNSWFNLVVHGFNIMSPLGRKYAKELKHLAMYSRPLIAEDRADMLESDIELNTVLRRGKNSARAEEQKTNLIKLLPSCESDIRSLSYSEVVFLNTVYLVEDLRSATGNCSHFLAYFREPKVRTGDMGNCMLAISKAVINTYLSRTLSGKFVNYSAPYLAQQLAVILEGCCHRVLKVQQAATVCADLIIQEVPSTLCQKTALFALLELLSLMWASCLEGETDEYEWKATYYSRRQDVSVELSDNYELRKATLHNFQQRARGWVLRVLDIAPLDVKGLLQTYLAESAGEDSAYGHLSLGRSFALEMGSAIPSTDQRLGAIENTKGFNINTASDFIAQYTTRQEYRFVDGIIDRDDEWTRGDNRLKLPWDKPEKSAVDRTIEESRTLLADLEARTLKQTNVAVYELRDILRKAAALLCRVKQDQCAIVQHLVGIPFAVFTKQSIKLGISLWLSVIKENPRMEARILVLVADNFEATVRRRHGLFEPNALQQDPFFQKQEFAPSDRPRLERQQARVHDLIAPHFRLLQFLSSHFNSSRLGSPDIERIYSRLSHLVLDALPRHSVDHPLAREAYFHAILLGLRILQHSTCLATQTRWRLKDRILSAALAWFARPPYYSFGGNRLQIKAESHLLQDVMDAFASSDVAGVGAKPDSSGALKSLIPRQELLLQLLHNEQTKLLVWLFPLEHTQRNHFPNARHLHRKMNSDLELDRCVATAWAENPALAVHLIPRLRHARIRDQVRWKVINHPQAALDVADALELLLGARLPQDVTFQLKYLLFWKPVNPITAVTYFLPAYGNHPSIIQYAMRALESHSVDITFFYVPQIVQLLRHDALGYVERYIIETAKFSQLFAHQIIWNMKANAFKDEDAQIPDSIKPALDKVMDSLVMSFNVEDRAFYGREFSFFNEVTGISGKLKPYIKKSKPEKKQKIEEELRQIKVEVGVYLPSNPDGVVVGIDRKSGKPLQSHAKAPYMATFRIRKEKSEDESGVQQQKSFMEMAANPGSNSYEVWQSAIFKVGDDCRQDVLALQLIAAFRNIFASVGLDVYVFPYRVTATAPGCGVIDVLPNTISRDMLGREAVNGLHEYFLSKYGGEESTAYQVARTNFVKSMAAYSVISYLLQFKDRHNGNIMIDDAGHIVHIDFGFCFDIAPGGIRFERAPFKLTAEMIAVMGGIAHHHAVSAPGGGSGPPGSASAGGSAHAYASFESLCVKAFLASRPHAEHLAQLVQAMLESGLPCFKPETMQNFRARFAPDKDEREAADLMRGLVRKSAGSLTTKQYDQFQLLTNGIPY